MDEIKTLLIELGNKMGRMQLEIEGMKQEIGEMKQKIETIDQKIEKLDYQMKDGFLTMEDKFREYDQKLEKVEKTILDRQFLFEQEYGSKIDAIYDHVALELQKNEEKSVKIHTLDTRLDRSEVELFNHEKRISVLERK